MTTYEPGDVVLDPVPFTDGAAVKQRPAVVVSGGRYNTGRPDLIVKPALATLAARAARRCLGSLAPADSGRLARHARRFPVP